MAGNPFPEMQNPYEPPPIDTGADGGRGETNRTVTILRQTGPWVRFLAVLGFIASGLVILGGLFFGLSMMALAGAAFGMGMMTVYVLIGLLYLIPAVYLNRYATNIKLYIHEPSLNRLDAALEAQKSFWKFMGIFTAIILGIYALIFVLGMVIGMAGVGGMM